MENPVVMVLGGGWWIDVCKLEFGIFGMMLSSLF
jgi:hypothetical protein